MPSKIPTSQEKPCNELSDSSCGRVVRKLWRKKTFCFKANTLKNFTRLAIVIFITSEKMLSAGPALGLQAQAWNAVCCPLRIATRLNARPTVQHQPMGQTILPQNFIHPSLQVTTYLRNKAEKNVGNNTDTMFLNTDCAFLYFIKLTSSSLLKICPLPPRSLLPHSFTLVFPTFHGKYLSVSNHSNAYLLTERE